MYLMYIYDHIMYYFISYIYTYISTSIVYIWSRAAGPTPHPPPKGLGAQVFVCRGDKWSSPRPPLWVGGACLYVHACMDVCMYLYVSMYVCMYSMPRPPVGGWGVSVCTCMYWCMYVFVCKYVCVYV